MRPTLRVERQGRVAARAADRGDGLMQGRIEDVSIPRARPLHEVAGVQGAPARLHYRRIYRKTALTDVLAVALAMLVAYRVAPSGFAGHSEHVWILIASTPVVVPAVFAMLHLYDAYRYTPAEEFRRIIMGVSLVITGLVTFSFLLKLNPSGGPWPAASLALAVVLALATRHAWHIYIGRVKAGGGLSFATILVGSNSEAKRLAALMEKPAFGFRAIGAVYSAAADRVETGVPLLGPIADLRDLIKQERAECVFVASSAMSAEEMTHVTKAVRLEGVEVRVTATLPQVLSSRLSVQPLAGVTALSLRPVRLTGPQALAKRIFDLAISGAGVVLLSPFLLAIAVAVKATSSGPVLYRQRRVGQRGRPFTMLKFRTMRTGADSEIDRLRTQHGVSDLMFKLRDDPRVTSAGHLLRRFSLDELPQLINVLRGEMSLVGPRPPLPEEVTAYEDWQFDRLEVPPGLTGLWQVSGRSELSFEECVRLDLFYIENWSLAYDLFILAKTLPVLLSQRGAF